MNAVRGYFDGTSCVPFEKVVRVFLDEKRMAEYYESYDSR